MILAPNPPAGGIRCCIGRRAFLSLLGGAAAGWPLAARAQQPARVIGFLNSLSADRWPYLGAFHQGLKEAGYVEGQNVSIEYRWADCHYDRLPALAVDLVRRRVDLIAATGGDPSALAAKAATTTTPIVFNVAEDPVKDGLVASLNRPGGNMTGVSILTASLEAKGLELLHELIPNAAVIAVLVNPSFAEAESQLKVVQVAAYKLGRQIRVLNVSSEREIDPAFAELVQHPVDALLVVSDPFFFAVREKLIALAARHAVPMIAFIREFTVAGGLMSYGTRLSDAYRQMGVYSGQILKGDKPADLPIVQPTKFELVINLRTAKTLGLQIPDRLLALADEVIE
ncbi:MAG: ABC transporter substrate-binding protein [Alphaproteobacteria bacterium]|nr:MAG: ABC transporter substrate-binding protein [Alphaproteobacteria bacterium]